MAVHKKTQHINTSIAQFVNRKKNQNAKEHSDEIVKQNLKKYTPTLEGNHKLLKNKSQKKSIDLVLIFH